MDAVAGESLQVRIDRKVYTSDVPDDHRLAIRGLEFEIPPRQFCCIVGPSGCGKTTLLNILSGIDQEAEGVVQFGDGTPLDAAPIGYMFQTPRLLPWLTVRENVRVVLDEEVAASGRAEQLLTEMELGDSLDVFPNRLSGGMQRRVALARAFAIRPRLLLLDEPFVSLDVPVGNRLREMLLELWRSHPTTVLFVTHDLREAIYLADRVLFLSRGPSRVILDIPVELSRPRQFEDPAIDDFRKRLMAKHSSILHGFASEETEAAEPAHVE